MIDPVILFKDAGPFAYLILLCAMAGIPVAVALAIVGVKLRIPAALHVGMPLMTVLAGVVGTHQGLTIVAEVIPKASFETRSVLAANGLSVSMYTIVIASWCAGALLFLSSTLTAISSFGRSFLTTDDHTATVATEMRGGSAVLAIAGATLLGWGAWFNYQAMYYSAMAKASMETKQALMAHAIEGAAPIPIATAAVAMVILFVGAAAVGMGMRHLTASVAISLVGSALIGALTATAPAISAMSVGGMTNATVAFGEKRLALMTEWGIELPTTDTIRRTQIPGVMLSIGDEIRVSDRVVEAGALKGAIADAQADAQANQLRRHGAEPHNRAVIEADRSTKLSALDPVFAACKELGMEGFDLTAVRSDHGRVVAAATSFEDTRISRPGDELLELRIGRLPRGFRMQTQHGVADAPDLATATVMMARLKDEYPDVDTAFIHVEPEMSVNDYLLIVAAVGEDPTQKVNGRPRQLFPFPVLRTDALPMRE